MKDQLLRVSLYEEVKLRVIRCVGCCRSTRFLAPCLGDERLGRNVRFAKHVLFP